MKHINQTTYYEIRDLEKTLNANRQTIRRWIDTGKLEGVRNPYNRQRMVSEEALQKFLKEFDWRPR